MTSGMNNGMSAEYPQVAAGREERASTTIVSARTNDESKRMYNQLPFRKTFNAVHLPDESGWFENSYLSGVLSVTLICVALRWQQFVNYPDWHRDTDLELAQRRVPYTGAFAATLVACIGCLAKTVSTTSEKKAALAMRLGVHMGVACFAMLCCSLDLVWIPVGESGHSINIAAQCVWFLTSSSMALLFHKMYVPIRRL
jgi:hypothetical protein